MELFDAVFPLLLLIRTLLGGRVLQKKLTPMNTLYILQHVWSQLLILNACHTWNMFSCITLLYTKLYSSCRLGSNKFIACIHAVGIQPHNRQKPGWIYQQVAQGARSAQRGRGPADEWRCRCMSAGCVERPLFTSGGSLCKIRPKCCYNPFLRLQVDKTTLKRMTGWNVGS